MIYVELKEKEGLGSYFLVCIEDIPENIPQERGEKLFQGAIKFANKIVELEREKWQEWQKAWQELDKDPEVV